jgi:hypothetical protein
MTARQEKVREALAVLHLGPRDKHYHDAALAEAEEWEAIRAVQEERYETLRLSNMRHVDKAISERARAEAAEAEADRLKAALKGLVFKWDCWCADPDAPQQGHEIACKAARAALAPADPNTT